MKLSKRVLSLVLALSLCVGLLPQRAFAEVLEETPEGKPTAFTDTNGETVNVEESWEEVYPYGAFLFPDGETNITEGGEPGVVKLYRLGGADGRVTAYVTYQPNVMQMEEGMNSYANAADTNSILIEVEDPQPAAAYQPIGRPTQPEPTQAGLLEEAYTGPNAHPNDRVLTVDADADSWQWYGSAYGIWQKVDGADKAQFVVDEDSLKEYDFRCVFTQDGVSYCTDSYRGVRYEKDTLDDVPEMPKDLDLNPEKTYSALEPDPDNPYLAYVFPVTFAAGEWVKEIRVTALDNDKAEPMKIGMFTLVDTLGGEIYSGAATQTLTVADDEEAQPYTITITQERFEADKSAGNAEIRVKRTGGNQTLVTVEYSTADGTAVAGRDYKATRGTIGFYGDVDEAVIKVPLINDGVKSDKELTFTVTLDGVKGDDTGLCTLDRTQAQVALTNSAAGGAAKNLVTMLYDAEAMDASGDVAITDQIAAPVDDHVVTGEQVVSSEEDILYGVIEGLDTPIPQGEGEGKLMTYNYGRITFPTTSSGDYWGSTASIAGKSPNDINNWSGGSAEGNGWQIKGKTPGTASLVIPYMNQMYKRFSGHFEYELEFASGWSQFIYGTEFVYGTGYFMYQKDNYTTISERIGNKATYDDGTAHYTKSRDYSKSWDVEGTEYGKAAGIRLDLEYWDAHDSDEDTYAKITSGTLDRRAFNSKLNLRIHTANDGESGGGNVATAPANGASLREGSGVYTSIKPRVSIEQKAGGVDSWGDLYVGSKIKVSLENTDSYKELNKDNMTTAVYLTNSKGKVMTATTKNGIVSGGPKVERSGKDYYITMVWNDMTQEELNDTYTINVVMTRVQTLVVDLGPSVPRKVGSDGKPSRTIDTARVSEAWEDFWNSTGGGENRITVGYSEVGNDAPHFSSTGLKEKYITKGEKAPQDPRFDLGEMENAQYINFNRSEEDRIVYNGKMYKGNETIWLTVEDLSFGRINFLYYKSSFLASESALGLSVTRAELYFDGDGDGVISGQYNSETGYFVLDSGAKDELVMILDRDASYNEVTFQPVDLGNGKFGEYYMKVFYSMTPRSLATPKDASSHKAQVLPAFTTSVTNEVNLGRLTEEQKSQRYIMPAKNADGSGYTSDGHWMFGPEATSPAFVDIPLGGDHSPVVTEGDMQTGFRYTWTPQFVGHLLYPYTQPDPINIEHSLAGDDIPLAEISYNSYNYKINTDAAGKENLNGYLGSFVANTTGTLCVAEQEKTADKLQSDANSVKTLQPEGIEQIRRSATPNAAHLGSVKFEEMGSTAVNPADSKAKYTEMMTDTAVDMPMNNLGFLGLGNIILNKDEVMLTIGVPLAGMVKAGGNTIKAGAPKVIAAAPASQLAQAAGALKALRGGSGSLTKMLTDPNGGGYVNEANKLKSKSFVVALILSAVFTWKYDTVTNKYYFKSFGCGVGGMLNFTFNVRFLPCPIIYLYVSVSLLLIVSTGGSIERTNKMREQPYVSPSRPRSLRRGEYIGIKTTKQNISIQFSGKVYIEVIDTKKGGRDPDTVKGFLISKGGEDITRKLASSGDVEFPGGERYIKIIALEDTVITSLNVIEEKESKLVWDGVRLLPTLTFEFGAGVGVEGLKFEVCISLTVEMIMTFGEKQADGSRKTFAFDYFSGTIGITVRVVFFGLSWDMQLVGFKVNYAAGVGWYTSWVALGKEKPIGPIGKSSASTQGDEEEYSLELKPLEDASGTQRIYSPTEGQASLMAYDSEDPTVPFQLSGFNSSVSSFKLADGLSLGNSYQVVTVNGANYVLYTISRSSPANPMDQPMLVLSRLVSTGGMDKVGMFNPQDWVEETGKDGKKVSGLKTENRSPNPYIPVDTLEGGADDGTGDLEFRAVVEGDTIRVAWVSYADNSTSTVLRDASRNTVVKQASFNTAAMGAEAVFTPAQVVSGEVGNRVLMPTALDDHTTAYVEAQPMTEEERADAVTNYTAALKNAGLDVDDSNPANSTVAKQRLVMQQALWDGNGKASSLCVNTGGALSKLQLPQGQTVENVEFTRSGDRYYAAFATRELQFTDEAGSQLAAGADAKNVLTIHRLFLTYFTTDGQTVTWANEGKNVLLRTLYDYEVNSDLKDGVFTGGETVPFDSPYFANLKFLNATLGDALTGDPESFTLMADPAPEDFLLFEMNGSTYVVRQGSLESITGADHQGTIIPFFATDEGFTGTATDENSRSASGRTQVTIGSDGSGGLAAVYVANVPATTNNGIFISKYDPTTGAWGKGVILAMNHMSVYEDSLAQNWNTDETKAAFLGEREGYDKGAMDQFTFTAPSMALSTTEKGNSTLLILTQGNMNYLKRVSVPADPNVEGDKASDTLVVDEEKVIPANQPPRGTGMYAISYGQGQQSVGKASLSFFQYDFTAGADLHANLSFENTGDVSIRGSKDSGQAIKVSLLASGESISEKELATWTITENIVPGQKVSLEGDFTLPETLPAGTTFGIKVSEGNFYQNLGGTPYSAALSGILTVEEKPELRFENVSVALSGVKGSVLNLDPQGNVILDVDFLAGNRGNKDAKNVYAQFSYDTGETDQNGNHIYAPIDLSNSALTVGDEEKLATLQGETGSDLPRGILYLGSMRSGYGRRVTGTVTLPPDQYFVGQSYTLGLHMELFSDADTDLTTAKNGLRSAEHGEYNTSDNLHQQVIDPSDSFLFANVLTLEKRGLVRIPVSFNASTGSKNPNIVLLELPDKENKEDKNQSMDKLLDKLYYEPGSYANGVGQGIVVIRAAKVGTGYIRIGDANTNTYLDFPFRVTEAGTGMMIYPDNARLSFFTRNKSLIIGRQGADQEWLFQTTGSGDNTVYESSGMAGTSVAFDTVAETIDLYFNGEVTVSSTFPNFKPQKLKSSDESSAVSLQFGDNRQNLSHTVTITINADNTTLCRVVERYAEDNPVYKAPKFQWTTSFPAKASILTGWKLKQIKWDSWERRNRYICDHIDARVPIQVNIIGTERISNINVKCTTKSPDDSSMLSRRYNQYNTAPNSYRLDFTTKNNGEVEITVIYESGLTYIEKLEVNWFKYDMRVPLYAQAAAKNPSLNEYAAKLTADEDADSEYEVEEIIQVDVPQNQWMTATLDESGQIPVFRVKMDESAPQQYAVVVAGEVGEIEDILNAPPIDTSENPEAILRTLDAFERYLYLAERGKEIQIPVLKAGINMVYAYCFNTMELLENYDQYGYEVVHEDGSVDTFNGLDECDFNAELFYIDSVKHNLTFVSDGGPAVLDHYLEEGEPYGVLPEIQRLGYQFLGWYTDEAKTIPATADTVMGDKSVYLYAKWSQPVQYKVTLDLNGHGSADWLEKTFTVEDEPFTLPIPADVTEGGTTYTFAGWLKGGGQEAQSQVTILPAEAQDVFYNAQWATGKKEGQVSFDQAGVTDSGVQGVDQPSLTRTLKDLACDPQMTDMESDTTVTMEMKLVDASDPDLDKETKAAVKAIAKASGSGTDSQVKDDLVSIEMTATTTEDGATTTKPLTDLDRVMEIPLRYDLTGRNRPQVFRFHDGAAQSLRRLASRPANYQDLDGAFYVSGSGADGVIYLYTSRFSLYSVTTTSASAFTILFDPTGGNEVQELVITDGVLPALPEPTKPTNEDLLVAYDFRGWVTDTLDPVLPGMPVTGDVTLHAMWAEYNVSKVTFNPGMGKVTPAYGITDIFGILPNGLPTPVNSGYNFVGWFTGETDGVEITPDTQFLASGEIFARYEEELDDGTWSYSGGGSGGGSGSGGSGGGSSQTVSGDTEAQKDALLSQFSDLNSGDWYRDGVAWALSKGIMNGVGGDTFAPAAPTSRAMIVTMLYRLEGQPGYNGSLSFTDVENGSWYADAVGWAAAKGIVTGYNASTFGPDDIVTREQLATILYRYAQTKGQSFQGTFTLDYPDAGTVSGWADEAMRWIVMNKVINGMGDGTLNPGGEGTRAQVATMLMRFSGLTQ